MLQSVSSHLMAEGTFDSRKVSTQTLLEHSPRPSPKPSIINSHVLQHAQLDLSSMCSVIARCMIIFIFQL
uniref:Uncharacterized protein n=1 Tax=Panagrolaimus sp. PS1159 TaxID=55785 RepID=A0AC35FI29_9BILA